MEILCYDMDKPVKLFMKIPKLFIFLQEWWWTGHVYLEKKKRMMDEKRKKNDDGQVYLEKMSPRKPI